MAGEVFKDVPDVRRNYDAAYKFIDNVNKFDASTEGREMLDEYKSRLLELDPEADPELASSSYYVAEGAEYLGRRTSTTRSSRTWRPRS